MFFICGPEKESCVANQTLKDKSCLVPCSGLYADVVDKSLDVKLQANMKTGRSYPLDRCILFIEFRFPYADSRAEPWGKGLDLGDWY